MNRTIDASPNSLHFLNYDIGLSSALTTLGFELLSLSRENPRKIGFQFSRTPELEQTVQEYFVGRLMIDARSFFENIKMLKNRIYSSDI